MSQEFNITGMIEEIPTYTPGTKPDGVTPFVRIGFKIAGKKMSVFDNVLPNYQDFKMGDVVDVVYTTSQNGPVTYNNIKTMTKAIPGNIQEQANSVPLQQVPNMSIAEERDRKTEASIVAQVIVKKTADLIASGQLESGHMQTTARQLTEIYLESRNKLLE